LTEKSTDYELLEIGSKPHFVNSDILYTVYS